MARRPSVTAVAVVTIGGTGRGGGKQKSDGGMALDPPSPCGLMEVGGRNSPRTLIGGPTYRTDTRRPFIGQHWR